MGCEDEQSDGRFRGSLRDQSRFERQDHRHTKTPLRGFANCGWPNRRRQSDNDCRDRELREFVTIYRNGRDCRRRTTDHACDAGFRRARRTRRARTWLARWAARWHASARRRRSGTRQSVRWRIDCAEGNSNALFPCAIAGLRETAKGGVAGAQRSRLERSGADAADGVEQLEQIPRQYR